MKRHYLGSACIFLLLIGLGSSAAAQPRDQVAVAGATLLRDGRAWTPHGFFQIAFATPPAAFAIPGANPVFEEAYNNFSDDEYRKMRETGADSVRINVAEDGADKDNAQFYDAAWLERVERAVRAARRAGLVVIVSLQDEAQTGASKSPLPDSVTQKVWSRLAASFADDLGIMLEMYNEPNLHPQQRPVLLENTPPAAGDWEQWRVAFNAVIRTIRASGARNVVVADGLASAEQLTGAPKLDDPLKSVVYASHPYPLQQLDQSRAAWDDKFGNFSRTAPVIVTEWGPGYYCDEQTGPATAAFFGYLQEHRVGLEVVAFDWPAYSFASAVQDYPNVTFSSFLNRASPDACTSANGNKPGVGNGMSTSYGPGELVRLWYLLGRLPHVGSW